MSMRFRRLPDSCTTSSGITARSSFCSVGAAAAAGLAARLLQLVCTRVCGDLWGWVGRISAGCRGEKNAASYAFLFSRRPRVQRTKSSCAARQCTCSGGCGAAAHLSLGPAPRPEPHAMYLKSGQHGSRSTSLLRFRREHSLLLSTRHCAVCRVEGPTRGACSLSNLDPV